MGTSLWVEVNRAVIFKMGESTDSIRGNPVSAATPHLQPLLLKIANLCLNLLVHISSGS
jgi:hypothetical protein